MSTNVEKVYAIGDAVLGPSSVIEAIAHGYNAAAEIDKRLTGESRIDQIKAEYTYDMTPPPAPEQEEAKTCPGELEPGQRCNNFREVMEGFTIEQMQHEATRCLRCDIKAAPEDEVEMKGTDAAEEEGGD